MSVPRCDCKVAYELADAKFQATVKHCALHSAAPELFEIVDAIIGLTEQVPRHGKGCHCIHCRAVKALFRARGSVAPEAKAMGKSA